jgi:hypothetical protein
MVRAQQDGPAASKTYPRRRHMLPQALKTMLFAVLAAVFSLPSAAALRIGVATYEPEKLLGSSGMSIGIVAAHLLSQGEHSGNMIMQLGGFGEGVALHDVILAHGVRMSCRQELP